MTRTRTFAAAALVAAFTLGRGEAGPQSSSQYYKPIGYQVTFVITQTSRGVASPSDDQLTIIFANRSVEGVRPPRPFFGEDIVQEFSFSGVDFVNNQLRFTRRVNDKSFLNARYIRVVNYGDDGWEGDQISMTVDGQEILKNVRMAPRIGDSLRGIQKFNPRDWVFRSYWEAELSRYRAAAK